MPGAWGCPPGLVSTPFLPGRGPGGWSYDMKGSKETGKMADFPKIPFERFQRFHRAFHGEGTWWNLCHKCGGKCETSQIGSLMPGEKEFIAAWLGLPVEVFQDRYLDRVVTPLGAIDVLKVKRCPFLDAQSRCAIAPVKVVLCEVYPISLHTEANKVTFSIDPWCPLSQHDEARGYLEQVGMPALHELGAPLQWYRAAELYESFTFDYGRIAKLRKDPTRPQPFKLEAIMSYRTWLG